MIVIAAKQVSEGERAAETAPAAEVKENPVKKAETANKAVKSRKKAV